MGQRRQKHPRRVVLKKETVLKLDGKQLDPGQLAQVAGGGCKYSCYNCTQSE